MTCSETRQYLFAFLDNELDAALSMEVQRHIEFCPLCAQECEIENEIRGHLAESLQKADDVAAFDEFSVVEALRASSSVVAASSGGSRRTWRFGPTTLGATCALAAALVFAVTLFVTNHPQPPAGGTLADALVDDFDHFVTEAKPLQIISSDADEVSEWLRERTALAVWLPKVDAGIGTLQGGRKCKINGKPAAFAVYHVGGKLVSVVALQESEQALAQMQRVDRDGHSHWIDYCRGHTVLACRRGELIYAVVSHLPEESLSALMPHIEG